MKNIFYLTVLLLIYSVNTLAQEERKHIRQGVKNYHENKFDEAELNFREALDLNNSSFEAGYNTGNSLYKQEKPAEAATEYLKLMNDDIPDNKKADLFYNIGNTFLKSQDYQKSIEAYKNALRLRPDDEDARYNLAWALAQLHEQQQNQDQQQQDQQNDDDDKQDQNQQQQADSNEQENDESQEIKNLSREEVERMLQALEEKEQQVKEKVDREKARSKALPNEKDW